MFGSGSDSSQIAYFQFVPLFWKHSTSLLENVVIYTFINARLS